MNIEITFRPYGTGIAGHVQPQIEFRWPEDQVVKVNDVNVAVGEYLKYYLLSSQDARKYRVFFQGEDRDWLLMEFWNQDIEGIRRLAEEMALTLQTELKVEERSR